MCEWLSQAEWCDVQLLCRGRVFSAHRAVLASVSDFLKKILLSCNEDNSPSVIVLPDFDLSAMFSVLYYIYNGEVFVSTSSLESFLDILITLEIFVDKSFLIRVQDKFQCYKHKLEKIYVYNKDVTEKLTYSTSRNVFKLESDYTDQVYVNIKKGLHAHAEVIIQGSLNADTTLNCNQTQRSRPYLENIHSQRGDRQKKSYLRDSFIETYPRNGNVNGLTAGVPAILNELYLNTTSEHLTSANVKDSIPPASTVSTIIHHSNQVYEHKINFNTECHKSIQSVMPLLFEKQIQPQKMSAFVDLRGGQSINNFVTAVHNQNYTSLLGTDLQQKLVYPRKCIDKESTKLTISNQVMQNPWCPRLPISYRPFRRKLHTETENVKSATVNDKNNNFELSLEPTRKIIQNDENLPKETENLSNLQPIAETGIIDLKCNVCNEQFTDTESLSSHIKCHSSARFTCNECHKTFSQLRNYKYHMSVHRGTREFAATCSVCGKYFNDRGYLSSHMKIHKNRKEYKCPQCPKSFNQRVAYNMHVRIHTGVKPHVCDQCGKAFSRKMLLKQHQRTHSGERPYACPHCDKRFADRSNMTLHLRLHTGVKPFSCTLCSKSFTKKHHLKSHLNYHTGAKPYSCPRCQLAFTQSSNMRTHFKKCSARSSDVGS